MRILIALLGLGSIWILVWVSEGPTPGLNTVDVPAVQQETIRGTGPAPALRGAAAAANRGPEASASEAHPPEANRLEVVLHWNGPEGSAAPADLEAYLDFWTVSASGTAEGERWEHLDISAELTGLGAHVVTLDADWRSGLRKQSGEMLAGGIPWRRTTCKPIKIPKDPAAPLPALHVTVHAPTVVRGTVADHPELPGRKPILVADGYSPGLRVWRLASADGVEHEPTVAWAFGGISHRTRRWELLLPGAGRYLVIGQDRQFVDAGTVYYTTHPVEFTIDEFGELHLGELSFDVPNLTVTGHLRVNGKPAPDGWTVRAAARRPNEGVLPLLEDDWSSRDVVRTRDRAFVLPHRRWATYGETSSGGQFEVPYLSSFPLDLRINCPSRGVVLVHPHDSSAGSLSLAGARDRVELDLRVSRVQVDWQSEDDDWWEAPDVVAMALGSDGKPLLKFSEDLYAKAGSPLWLSPGRRYRLQVGHFAYHALDVTLTAPPVGETRRFVLKRKLEEDD